ncbi:MAG: hypothetical protein NUV69_02420 [Candidatus Curtissbacteria bacterium]|nr:hypothetical protein [Candidatus Curtissbacteria bacterium]
MKIQENAPLISKIYAQNNVALNASFVDLHLTGRLMFSGGKSILITGNKKDFPDCLFSIEGVINAKTAEGTVHNFYALKFDEAKFKKAYENLDKLK